MNRFREQANALRGELILEAAGRMLASGGCEEISTEKLAKAVGVGKGTIYLHFPKQDDWIEAALSRATPQLSEALAERAPGDAAARLCQAVSSIIDSVMDASAETLSAPCCLRRSPCRHRGWHEIEEPLQVLILDWQNSSEEAVSLDPKFATQVLHGMLTAAVSHGDSSLERVEKCAGVRRGYLALLGLNR